MIINLLKRESGVFRFFFLFALLLCFQKLSAQSPKITSFSPLNGPVGTELTITGTNFNTTPSNNTVYFGATKANVLAASTSSLTVSVPVGATHAPISVLNTSINQVAFSPKAFLPTFSPSKGSITASDFSPKVDFTAGPNTGYLAIGDLDGDGKADMVGTNGSANTVSIFLNTGSSANPAFAASFTLPTGDSPQGVAIGDIDGDGKLDMAITSYNSNSVGVYLNTSVLGSISFTARVDVPLESCPFFVEIRDMDGDGRADLIAANKDSNLISIVLNTGSINTLSFAPKVDYYAGSNVYSLAVGDLDGDGKPDVAAAAYNDDNVAVFRNTSVPGVVSMDPKIDLVVNSPYSISIGDVDGDGNADLVTANLLNNNVSVLRNTSSLGNISFAPKMDFAAGSRVYNVAIGDLDGDGKPDLATSNYNNNTVSVLHNTANAGNISFAPVVEFASGNGPDYVSIGDMDGDGKSDMIVANYTDGTVSLLRNAPINLVATGTLSAVNTTYGTSSATPASFTVSGSGLHAGITITPPAGFEVSQTTGGTSGYAGSGTAIVVGSAGNVTATTVYVRLAAGINAGTYSGDIACSSTGAATVNIATVSSTVSPAALNITAVNATRTYGEILTGGSASTAFTSTGLQNEETIGSVTLTYAAGAGNGNTTVDPVGTYTSKITPSAAIDGTFTASNYTITYTAGNLIVEPAGLTITATDAHKTYGSTLSNASGSTAFTSTSLKNSETIGSVSIAYAAGTGNGNSATDAVGIYNSKIIPNAATGGTFNVANYTINYVSGNIIVEKAPLTITADHKTRAFGASDPVFTASYSGFIQGETATVLSAQPTFFTNATTNSPIGDYTIIPSGAAAANYTINYVNGILSVLDPSNSAPTLAAIANQLLCNTPALQSIALSGISPGSETSQTTVLSVSSNNSSLFSNLSVTDGNDGTGTLSYNLNPGVSGTASVTITVKDNGGIANGGVDSFSRSFTITVNPGTAPTIISDLGTSISKGLTARLTASGGTSYQWSNAAGIISSQNTNVLTVRPLMNTTYTVTATNAQGCTSVQSITINVVEDYQSIDAMNVITPNGDGRNDTWVIRNIDAYPNNTVKVFDRAGRIVYSKKGYTNDWDGSFNGSPLNQDTYYFIVDLGPGINPVKGFISIVKQ